MDIPSERILGIAERLEGNHHPGPAAHLYNASGALLEHEGGSVSQLDSVRERRDRCIATANSRGEHLDEEIVTPTLLEGLVADEEPAIERLFRAYYSTQVEYVYFQLSELVPAEDHEGVVRLNSQARPMMRHLSEDLQDELAYDLSYAAGLATYNLEQWMQGIRHFSEALKMARKLHAEDLGHIAWCEYYLGKCLLNEGKGDPSEYLENAASHLLEFSREEGTSEAAIDACAALSVFHLSEGMEGVCCDTSAGLRGAMKAYMIAVDHSMWDRALCAASALRLNCRKVFDRQPGLGADVMREAGRRVFGDAVGMAEDPDSANLLIELARTGADILYCAQDFEQLIAVADVAVDLPPVRANRQKRDAFSALRGLAVQHLRILDRERAALSHLQEKRFPDAGEALSQAEALAKEINLEPELSRIAGHWHAWRIANPAFVDKHLEQARGFLNETRFEEAIRLYGQLLEVHPDNPEVAVIHDGIVQAKSALARRHAEPLVASALKHLAMGKFKQALANIKEAQQLTDLAQADVKHLNKTRAHILERRGQTIAKLQEHIETLMAAGNYDEARRKCKAAEDKGIGDEFHAAREEVNRHFRLAGLLKKARELAKDGAFEQPRKTLHTILNETHRAGAVLHEVAREHMAQLESRWQELDIAEARKRLTEAAQQLDVGQYTDALRNIQWVLSHEHAAPMHTQAEKLRSVTMPMFQRIAKNYEKEASTMSLVMAFVTGFALLAFLWRTVHFPFLLSTWLGVLGFFSAFSGFECLMRRSWLVHYGDAHWASPFAGGTTAIVLSVLLRLFGLGGWTTGFIGLGVAIAVVAVLERMLAKLCPAQEITPDEVLELTSADDVREVSSPVMGEADE